MQDPTTQTMKVSELNGQISQVIERVSHKEIRVPLVEKEGRPVAAIVTPEDLSRLEQLERDWETDNRALQWFTEAFADIPVDELEENIAQIIADDRANAEARRRSAGLSLSLTPMFSHPELPVSLGKKVHQENSYAAGGPGNLRL